MTATPEFIDSRDGNTLALALARVLGDYALVGIPEGGSTPPAELAIAAAFFTPTALVEFAPHLDGLKHVRLMFDTEAPCDVELRRPCSGVGGRATTPWPINRSGPRPRPLSPRTRGFWRRPP